MLTLQEVYDKVKAHLLQQGKRATRAGIECVYRTEDGLKCAIGCLIPDEAYDPAFEGRAIYKALKVVPGLPDYESFRNRDKMYRMINDLQGIHDTCEPSIWAIALENLAKDYELTP